jgi:predicted ATP-dependent endonuclease of OLD family
MRLSECRGHSFQEAAMYIFALNLRHFRSFHDLWVFPNRDVNIIVGPNNCGKTSVLRALALLLDPNVNLRRPDVVSRFDFHNIDLQRPIELYLWLKPRFREIEREDGERELQYNESEDVIGVFFDKYSEWQVETTLRLDHLGEEEHHPVRLVPFTVEPMETEMPEHESLLAIRLRATWNPQQEAADIDLSIIDQMDNEIVPLGFQQKELLGFKMLGSRRDPLRELSLSRRSILSQMLNEDEVTLALRRILTSLDDAKRPLLEQESVRNLMERLGNLVAPEFVGALVTNLGSDFTLTFLSGDLWRLRGATSIATTVGLGQDEDTPLPLEYQGDGAQNLILLFHLIELLREGGTGSIIVLEEPEQNLEPALARCAFGELCLLSRRPENQRGQVFVTTHSPVLVNELKGAECLLIFSEHQGDPGGRAGDSYWRIISAQHLSQDSRKKLDQRRERYVSTLFARQVLIVEGSSEIGFLPVAFRYLAGGTPYENPYHLGLEVMDGQSRDRAVEHATILKDYGRICHLLRDYDVDNGVPHDDLESLRARFGNSVDFVTCWPSINPLDFTAGCDLEVILAAYVPPCILFEAIKYAYADAGHPLRADSWVKACDVIEDRQIVEAFPAVYGDVDLNEVDLEGLGNERTQRAFLFVLLHGPHSCKSAKDMRMIADVLAESNAFPAIVDDLRRRILRSILRPQEINHDEPYLAPRA